MRGLLFNILWAVSRGGLRVEARGDSAVAQDIRAFLERIPDRSGEVKP